MNLLDLKVKWNGSSSTIGEILDYWEDYDEYYKSDGATLEWAIKDFVVIKQYLQKFKEDESNG